MSGKVSGNVWGELEFSAMIDSGWLAGRPAVKRNAPWPRGVG